MEANTTAPTRCACGRRFAYQEYPDFMRCPDCGLVSVCEVCLVPTPLDGPPRCAQHAREAGATD